MAKFVLVYNSDGDMSNATEAEQQKAMEAWMGWFGSLGEDVTDFGNPFGPACTVAGDGSVSDGGTSSLTGYSIITADDLAGAAEKAKGCPVLADGGSVEVYEAMPIG